MHTPGVARAWEGRGRRPLVKCRLRTCGPDLRTGKWLGLVLGLMLRVRVSVRVSVMVNIKVSSSILPCCWSAGAVRSPHLTRGRGRNAERPECRTITLTLALPDLGVYYSAAGRPAAPRLQISGPQIIVQPAVRLLKCSRHRCVASAACAGMPYHVNPAHRW